MKTARVLGLIALALTLGACTSGIQETTPSEDFRKALDEVMNRQPSKLKLKADEIDRRRKPVILSLSLEDCIELAMAHNRAIMFEHLNAELAATQTTQSKSNLDFTLGASVGYSREEQELQQTFFGDNRDKDISAVTNYNLNASLPFATGTTVDIEGGFVRNDSNNPFQNFEFYPTATVRLKQHLLNGFGLTPNLGNTWIAEGEERIAGLQINVTRNEQAYQVALAYWNLVEAIEDHRVLLEQEELAKESLKLAKDRLEAEIGTRLDVLTQESNLKAQQRGIIQAETLVEQRTDELLYAIHPNLLHGYVLFENYNVIVEPETEPDYSRVGADQPVMIEEIKAGLRQRPEIDQARERVKNAGIRIDVAEYGVLPTLDLEGDFTVKGFGKDANDSFESFTDLDNIGYGFRATFGVPLQNRAARGALAAAEIQKRNAILSARDTETQIIMEVAGAVRQMESARRGVDAAEEAEKLANELWKAENERASAGLSTAFEVKQIQNDWTAAKRDLVRSRIELEKARLGLQKATGDLGR